MKLTARIALAALLIVATACHKSDPKEAQLKALDEAYKSGVFTKEEYDAKKQALLGTPTPPTAPPAAAVAPAPADATPLAPAPDQNPPAGAPPPSPAAMPPPDTAPAPAPAQTFPPPAPAQPAPVYTPPAAPQAAPAPVGIPAAPPPAAQSAEPEPAPLAGCRDAETRAGGPNGAQERFFLAPEDAVRKAALQAFANLDFNIHNSTAHEMEASRKGRLNTVVGAGTERVILHFTSVRYNGQIGTKVVGETKRGIMGRVTQKPWTGAVLAQIACNLRGGR